MKKKKNGSPSHLTRVSVAVELIQSAVGKQKDTTGLARIFISDLLKGEFNQKKIRLLTNCEFEKGDILSLHFDDGTTDGFKLPAKVLSAHYHENYELNSHILSKDDFGFRMEVMLVNPDNNEEAAGEESFKKISEKFAA